MFPSRDEKGNTASHRVAIIDRIYSKLFFIYVPPVLFFCFFVFPSLENADIESSFVSPLPVGDTWSICHSVLKHEIQSRDVVRAPLRRSESAKSKRSESSRFWQVEMKSECKTDSIEFQLVATKEFADPIWNLY